MKSRPWAGLAICAIAIGMVLPVTSVNAVPPIAPVFPIIPWTVGNPGGDTFWFANPGLCALYSHVDGIVNPYLTGVEVYDLSYTNAMNVPPLPPTFYIEEALIPWIRILTSDNVWNQYGHGVPGAQPNLVFNGVWVYSESANQPFVSTTLTADYDLDMNVDGVIDFTFQEAIDLRGSFNPGVGWPGGVGTIMITPTVVPPLGLIQMNPPNGPILRIVAIEYSFILDPDISGLNVPNNIFTWFGGWVQINNEVGLPPIGNLNGDVGMIQDPATGLSVKFRPLCNLNVAPFWPHGQCFFSLAWNLGEYSQLPAVYLNGQNTMNTDVYVWYHEMMFVDPAFGFWPPSMLPEGLILEDLQ